MSEPKRYCYLFRWQKSLCAGANRHIPNQKFLVNNLFQIVLLINDSSHNIACAKNNKRPFKPLSPVAVCKVGFEADNCADSCLYDGFGTFDTRIPGDVESTVFS